MKEGNQMEILKSHLNRAKALIKMKVPSYCYKYMTTTSVTMLHCQCDREAG